MKNNKKKFYMIALTCVTVFCVIFGVAFHVTGFTKGESGHHTGIWPWNSESGNNTDTIAIDGKITAVTVESDVLSVILKEGDEPSITYTLPENATPTIEQEDGKLTIGVKYKGSVSDWLEINTDYEMVITLPEDTKLDNMEVKLDAGNLEVYGIDLGEVNAEMDAGNLEIYDCAIDYIKAEADTGNIEMHNTTVEIGDIEADTGNVEIEGSVSALTASVDMGNIEITSDKDASEMDLDLSYDMGNGTVNGKDWND